MQKYKVNHDPEARVYPHGPLSLKKKSWVNAKNPNEARLLAVDSISDSSLKIKGKNLQEFLVDCFMSKPSRFPLILLTGTSNLFYSQKFYHVPLNSLTDAFSTYKL